MNDEILFKALKKQTKSVLLELLHSAFHEMKTEQRHTVFRELMQKIEPPKAINKKVIEASKTFYDESLAGVYYSPFNINSKNFSYIPEETELWFDKLADLLKLSSQLTEQKEHASAVQSFELLYELISDMESGDEIVFADECGSWMIPTDEKKILNSYILSLAEVKAPEEYAEVVIPLIIRDSYQSFFNKIYSAAKRHGNKEQRKILKDEIDKQNIRIKSDI